MECKIKYGRRIRNGHNGDVQWCELSSGEVTQALVENAMLNAKIFEVCLQQALAIMNLNRPETEPSVAVNPGLRREVESLARALFEPSALKGFVALQERLDEKVHHWKVNGF